MKYVFNSCGEYIKETEITEFIDDLFKRGYNVKDIVSETKCEFVLSDSKARRRVYKRWANRKETIKSDLQHNLSDRRG